MEARGIVAWCSSKHVQTPSHEKHSSDATIIRFATYKFRCLGRLTRARFFFIFRFVFGSMKSILPAIHLRPKTPSWDVEEPPVNSSFFATEVSDARTRISPGGLPASLPSVHTTRGNATRIALEDSAPEEEEPSLPHKLDREMLEKRPRLFDQKPKTWNAPRRVTSIARNFDQMHFEHSRRGMDHLDALSADPTSKRHERAFQKRLLELRANRYTVQPLRLQHRSTQALGRGAHLRKPEFKMSGCRGGPWLPPAPYEPDSAQAPREEEEEEAPAEEIPWSLQRSIWAPRPSLCESNDFFDGEAVESDIITNEWNQIAAEESAFILKNDDDEIDGAVPPVQAGEVAEVLQVLLNFKREIISLYNFWAGSAATPAMVNSLQTDSFLTIQWGAYLNFVQDHDITDEHSKHCQITHATILFEGLNSDDSRPAKGENASATKVTDKKSLDRREFLQALIRLAVMKFVKSGETTDVSDAVRRLMTGNIIGKATPEALEDSNAFRRDVCYLEQNDNVLQSNNEGLRSLYAGYAKMNGSDLKGFSSNQSCQLPAWLQLLEDREMFEEDGKGIKFSDAIIIFLRSRMRCRDDGLSFKDKTLGKMALNARSMFWPDFCEALVRIAVLAERLPESAGEEVDWPPHEAEGSDGQWLVRRLTSLVAFFLKDL